MSCIGRLCSVVCSFLFMKNKSDKEVEEHTNNMIEKYKVEQVTLTSSIEEDRLKLFRINENQNLIFPPGMSKSVVVTDLKKDIAIKFQRRDEINKQLNTLYATRAMLRESMRTAEMASEMEFILQYMKRTNRLDTSRVIDNIDGIAEEHDKLKEISDAMSISNAWFSDISSSYDDEVEAYLKQAPTKIITDIPQPVVEVSSAITTLPKVPTMQVAEAYSS